MVQEENHEVTYNIDQCNDPELLLNIVSTFMPFDTAKKYEILSTFLPKNRAFIILTELAKHKEFLSITSEIQQKRESISPTTSVIIFFINSWKP